MERERAQLAHERELLRARESLLATLDRELAALPADDGELDELRSKLIGVDETSSMRARGLLRYAELEPLRAHLKEIEEEGKRRKEARDRTRRRRVRHRNARTRHRGDERACAAGRPARAPQPARRSRTGGDAAREVAGARDASRAFATERAGLETQSKRSQNFAAEWPATLARRDRPRRNYRVHLESASLAATLAVREEEVRRGEARVARATAKRKRRRANTPRPLKSYDRARTRRSATRSHSRAARGSEPTAQLEDARETREKLAADIARLDEVRARWQERFARRIV